MIKGVVLEFKYERVCHLYDTPICDKMGGKGAGAETAPNTELDAAPHNLLKVSYA